MRDPAVQAFLAALDPALRDRYRARPELDAELARLLDDARSAHPTLVTDVLITDIAAYAGEDPQTLASVRAADLALAAACSRQDASAIARFEATLFDQIDAVHARMRPATVTLDELRQGMRVRLFVAAAGTPPRIASYRGRGDLRSWVRMAATRYLIDLTRADGARPDHPASDDQLADLATTSNDPALAFLKDKYRSVFRAAFADALGELSSRERNMLRLRYLEGLEVAEVATIFDIHRVTMSRALSKLRGDLLTAIHRALGNRLEIDQDEVESIMGLVDSQLDISLGGLLESAQRR